MTTGGENDMPLSRDQLGFEIDAQQEGGWEEGADNYADVRFLGESIAPAISDNGGLVWGASEEFQRLSEGETGRIHTHSTWCPDILTLAVSRDHYLGDCSAGDVASGNWKPAGAGESIWDYDPNVPVAHVGPGERTNWKDRPSTPGSHLSQYSRACITTPSGWHR